MSRTKNVLGMYVGEKESAKFWLSIMNNLKNRGVEDILGGNRSIFPPKI